MARPGVLLVATSLAAFTATLDNTVTAVALRDLQADLGSSVLGLQGVVTAYTVVLAGLLLAGGALVDVAGAGRVLRAGTALFAGASALCALSGSVGALVGWRVLQGLAAALLLPGALAVLAGAYPDPVRRRRALAAWTAVGGAALVAGPVVGGELVARHGWRAVFWVNVPLCALVLLLTVGPLPRGPRRQGARRGVDVAGAALACLALGAAAYGVVLLGRHGVGREAVAALLVAAVAGVLLAVVERRAPAPLLPPELVRDRRLRGATLAALGGSLAVFVVMVFLSLFLQLVLDHDARGTGHVLLALPAGLVVTAVATSRWRSARVPVVVGTALAGGGLLGLAAAVGPMWATAGSCCGCSWSAPAPA